MAISNYTMSQLMVKPAGYNAVRPTLAKGVWSGNAFIDVSQIANNIRQLTSGTGITSAGAFQNSVNAVANSADYLVHALTELSKTGATTKSASSLQTQQNKINATIVSKKQAALLAQQKQSALLTQQKTAVLKAKLFTATRKPQVASSRYNGPALHTLATPRVTIVKDNTVQPVKSVLSGGVIAAGLGLLTILIGQKK